MCGRFVRITPIPVIVKRFKAKQIFADLTPSYNIAPSQNPVGSGLVFIHFSFHLPFFRIKAMVYDQCILELAHLPCWCPPLVTKLNSIQDSRLQIQG
jgi:hypothetical protein